MAPFAGDGIGPAHQLLAYHHAAARPGAEDSAEDDGRGRAGAVDRFGERKTIGVVGEAHRTAYCGLQVFVERMADEADGVGVLDEASGRRDCPWDSDPDRSLGSQSGIGRCDQLRDGFDGACVVAAGCGQTLAKALRAGTVEGSGFDLGSAQVDPDAYAFVHPASSQHKRLRMEGTPVRRLDNTAFV